MFAFLRVSRGAVLALVAGSLLAACSPHSGTTSVPAVPKAADPQQPASTGILPASGIHYIPLAGRRSADTGRRTLCSLNPCHPGVALSYGGGAVQHHPHYYLVFWGWHNVSPFDPAGMASYVQSFVQGLQGSSYLNTLSQYSGSGQGFIQNSAAEYGGAFWDDGSTPSSPSQDQVYTEALTGLHVFGDQSQDANYIVLTPTGHSAPGSFSSFCGYHSYKTFAPSSSLIFSYIPYIPDGGSACAGPLTGASMVIGHEIAEAQTDPFPNTGWVDQSDPNDTEEVGDKCAWLQSNVTLSTGTFPVQSLWSNASMASQGGNGCVFSYTPSGPPMTCTPDAMGYCVQVTGSSLKNTSCQGDVYQTGTTTYGLYKSGAFQNTYTYTVTVTGQYCIERDTWRPVDPATDVSDPNLI